MGGVLSPSYRLDEAAEGERVLSASLHSLLKPLLHCGVEILVTMEVLAESVIEDGVIKLRDHTSQSDGTIVRNVVSVALFMDKYHISSLP